MKPLNRVIGKAKLKVRNIRRLPPPEFECGGYNCCTLAPELKTLEEKLAAHAEVVEAAKGVIESARLWSSQNYPTFDRIELEVTEALAAALAKLEEAGE